MCMCVHCGNEEKQVEIHTFVGPSGKAKNEDENKTSLKKPTILNSQERG